MIEPDARSAPDGQDSPDAAAIDVLTVLEALADPVRLEIVCQLADQADQDGLMCGQIKLAVTKSTASHHLKTLARAGITAEREQGTCKYISLRRADLDQRFPGLLDSVLGAARVNRDAAAARGATTVPAGA